MKIIGIVGVAGSGKTIVARHLTENYGYSRSRFAEPLKNMLKHGLGLTDEEVDGDRKMVPLERFGGVTPRYMMQTLGTEWGRRCIYRNLWVDAWREWAVDQEGPLVVDDVRFANEAAVIRELGGTVWRVYRPGVEIMRHPSELAMKDIKEDEFISNATTVGALLRSVDALMRAA